MENAVEKKKARKTNFEKITRSPETLAEMMVRHACCDFCIYDGENFEKCEMKLCKAGTMAWLKLPSNDGGD